jgi:hypothetical protein
MLVLGCGCVFGYWQLLSFAVPDGNAMHARLLDFQTQVQALRDKETNLNCSLTAAINWLEKERKETAKNPQELVAAAKREGAKEKVEATKQLQEQVASAKKECARTVSKLEEQVAAARRLLEKERRRRKNSRRRRRRRRKQKRSKLRLLSFKE